MQRYRIGRGGARVVAALRRQWRGLSGIGVALGTLFFAAALTPTLVPRTYLTQGAVAGASFAVGYGFGVGWRWLWAYLELPEPKERIRSIANAATVALCLTVCATFLWHSAGWQDSIRTRMGMAPVESMHPVKVCLTALLVFVVLLMLARLFRHASNFISGRARRFVPRRVANVIGFSLAVLLFWSLANGVFFRMAFRMLDSSYREYDALLEPERPQPGDPMRTGSAGSLVKWRELGRAGREYIASGPTGQEIGAFTGRLARQPVRVYVGLRSAPTARDRAQLALAEMKRVGAFERSALVLITPTGTGWVDPASMSAVEYLHDGDIASVALQYSYLSSPLSLIVQPEYGSEAARALFAEIYEYWTHLPKGSRPKLYLHGLSLGAMNSERSLELFEMIGDPIDGALWSGPPFGSRLWRSLTERRNPGTPAWLPEFRDGRFVRFMNQSGSKVPADRPWGVMRLVYLQYASDAIVFFDPRAFFRPPAWLVEPRGPDVSPDLRWYPVVTGLQLALDMAVATSPPMGHGHVYAPLHYVEAWQAVVDRSGWTEDRLAALKRHLSEEAARATGQGDGNEDAYSNRGG